MLSTFKERLLHFIKEEGITPAEFSRRMGQSPSYVSAMRKYMPPEKIEKMEKLFPQLNRNWLLYGEGSMYKEEITEQGIEPYHLHKRVVPLIPLQAAAGTFPMYTHGVYKDDCSRVYCPYHGAELAIKVKGDSMEPEIEDGTVLFIKKINDRLFVPWGEPLVLDTENGSLCKMLYPSDKGEEYVEARSYNPAYPPFQIPLESVFGVYRILGEENEVSLV